MRLRSSLLIIGLALVRLASQVRRVLIGPSLAWWSGRCLPGRPPLHGNCRPGSRRAPAWRAWRPAGARRPARAPAGCPARRGDFGFWILDFGFRVLDP